MAVTTRPHDLPRLSGAAALGDTPPGWVSASIAACPWGVVRRAPHPLGLVPVGLRGPERWQRHAALVPRDTVTRSVPPEELRERRPWLPLLAVTLSAVTLLLAAELEADAAWGPIGGVGFELATGKPATHPGSDLDPLIRAPRRIDRPLSPGRRPFSPPCPARSTAGWRHRPAGSASPSGRAPVAPSWPVPSTAHAWWTTPGPPHERRVPLPRPGHPAAWDAPRPARPSGRHLDPHRGRFPGGAGRWHGDAGPLAGT